MFTDFTKLKCVSGNGGNGIISWIRAKYLPKGGPSGGNGGKGGSVKIKVSENIHCLDHLRGKNRINAQRGNDGSSNNKTGRSGKDTTILVPAGTIVINT